MLIMPREIEVKFKVSTHRAVRRALGTAGAEYLGTSLQTDTFYDTPDGAFSGGDRALRIRQVKSLRGRAATPRTRALLTYKGPRGCGGSAKAREEIQTHLDDAESAAKIIEILGMRPSRTIQKRRATYRLGRCLVELDELPIIGHFVEIEGPSERAIERVRRKLGLDAQPTTCTYLELLDRAPKRSGRRGRSVTFD